MDGGALVEAGLGDAPGLACLSGTAWKLQSDRCSWEGQPPALGVQPSLSGSAPLPQPRPVGLWAGFPVSGSHPQPEAQLQPAFPAHPPRRGGRAPAGVTCRSARAVNGFSFPLEGLPGS